MNKIVRVSLVVMSVLAVPALAHAQSGCISSPENPTAVLGVIGGSAACAWPSLRNWFGKRRQK